MEKDPRVSILPRLIFLLMLVLQTSHPNQGFSFMRCGVMGMDEKHQTAKGTENVLKKKIFSPGISHRRLAECGGEPCEFTNSMRGTCDAGCFCKNRWDEAGNSNRYCG